MLLPQIYVGLPWVDCYRFGGIVGLVNPYKTVCQLKHVVAQTDDHKLSILCALLDVVCHNGHILEICTTQIG